jgi:hypothetical protein
MKKIIYGAFLCSVFIVSSCNKEDSKVSPLDSVDQTNFVTPTGESILTNFTASDGKTYSITKFDLSRMKLSNRRSMIAITPKSSAGQLSKIQSNRRMVIVSAPPYIPAVYFGDLFKSEAIVTVPNGSFVGFNTSTGASINGFFTPDNPINTSASTLEGSTLVQNGNTYRFITYSYIPIFNSVDFTVSGPTLPRSLTGNVFSYVEITP